VIRIAKRDTSAAIPITRKIRERVVERCQADRLRLPEIIFRILYGFCADRKAALVAP